MGFKETEHHNPYFHILQSAAQELEISSSFATVGLANAGKKAKQRKNKNCAGLTRAQPGTHSVLALLATEQHSLSKICVASLVINKAYLVLVLKAHFFLFF